MSSAPVFLRVPVVASGDQIRWGVSGYQSGGIAGVPIVLGGCAVSTGGKSLVSSAYRTFAGGVLLRSTTGSLGLITVVSCTGAGAASSG